MASSQQVALLHFKLLLGVVEASWGPRFLLIYLLFIKSTRLPLPSMINSDILFNSRIDRIIIHLCLWINHIDVREWI